MTKDDATHLKYILDEARKRQARYSWEQPESKRDDMLQALVGSIMDALEMIVNEVAASDEAEYPHPGETLEVYGELSPGEAGDYHLRNHWPFPVEIAIRRKGNPYAQES